MKLPFKALIIASSFLLVSQVPIFLNGNFSGSDLILAESNEFENRPASFSVDPILDQKFYFLAKGHQAFVFVSQDKQYVLKLLKLHYPQVHLPGVSFRFSPIPFANTFYRIFFKQELQKQARRDFKSYLNAIDKFKEESLVSYIHLTESFDLKKNIQCYDKTGILHSFPADKTCFLIQKNVPSLESTLHFLIEENKIDDAKVILKNLIDLIHLRKKLGFHEPTNKFHANFGCVGLRPVQYDIGKLLTKEDLQIDSQDEKFKDISIYKLRKWIKKDFPSLIDYLDELQKDCE